MTEGAIIYAICESCGEETPHRVLRGRMGSNPESGFDGTVQCITCKTIHNVNFPMEKPVKVQSIISDGNSSEKSQIEFGPLEVIGLDEEFFYNDHNLLVTSIESNGKRVTRSRAKEIDCLWLKIFDTVMVKVSVVKGENTKSNNIEATPEEEFAVGDLLEFGKDKVVIDKIKTTHRMVYREGSPIEARSITRIYTKIVKERRY